MKLIQSDNIGFQVSTEEGKHLATQFGCPFYETSAALRHYIDDAFFTLVREIRRKEGQRVNVDQLNAHFNHLNEFNVLLLFCIIFFFF